MLHHRSSDITTPQSKCEDQQDFWVLSHLLDIYTAMCTGWLALTLLSVLSLGTQAFNSWLVKCFEDPQYEEMLWLAQDRLGQTAERKQIVVTGQAWQGSPLPRPCRTLATRYMTGCGRVLHGEPGREGSGQPQRAGAGDWV